MRLVVFLVLSGSLFISQKIFAMREFEIDEIVTRTIKISDKRPCTIMFPAIGGITSIQGTNITKNAKIKAGYYVEYTPRSNFFSVRAIGTSPGDGYINVVYHRKIVPLRLKFEGDIALADNSIIFRNPSRTGSNSFASGPPSVTPAALISLIDKSKAYVLLKKHRPEALSDVRYRRLMQVNAYPKFDCIVDEGWRYDSYDVLIFKIFLKNKTNEHLTLDLKSFSIRIGTELYPASIVQCSPTIPASATTIGYVGIAGSPHGGRANISLQNRFKFLITETLAEANKGRLALMKAVELIRSDMPHTDMKTARLNLMSAEKFDPALSGIVSRFSEKLTDIESIYKYRLKLNLAKRKIESLEKKDGEQ